MKGTEHITGIILAGGKSKRMGHNKALLSFQGKPFIAHAIAALKPLVTDLFIVADDKQYEKFGTKRVNDLIKDAGPLAGVYSGLHHSTTENNLIVSCDVPLLDAPLLQQLIDANAPEYDIIQFQSGNKTIPLIALYKKRCASFASTLLESGERRLRVFVDRQHTKTIVLDEDKAHRTLNVNTTQDLNVLNNEFDH